MAASQTAKEALRAWLNLLSPEERRIAEATMGASMPASAAAPDEPTNVDTQAEPTVPADPSTMPIPEEPNLTFLAQQEWYDSQDKIFQGPIPPDTPWQGDDLSAQPSSSASAQPMAGQKKASPQAPDAEAWLLPKPDTCLFNIFGEPFQLQDIKECARKVAPSRQLQPIVWEILAPGVRRIPQSAICRQTYQTAYPADRT